MNNLTPQMRDKILGWCIRHKDMENIGGYTHELAVWLNSLTVEDECEHEWMVNWRVDKERDPYMRICTKCDRKERQEARPDMSDMDDRWNTVEDEPKCKYCGGKVDTVNGDSIHVHKKCWEEKFPVKYENEASYKRRI